MRHLYLKVKKIVHTYVMIKAERKPDSISPVTPKPKKVRTCHYLGWWPTELPIALEKINIENLRYFFVSQYLEMWRYVFKST